VKRDHFMLVLVALVVTGMLVFGYRMAARGPSSAAAGSPAKGQLAPEFALQSLDGKTVRLSDLRGKAVLLNFWATWCSPCKIEMPWFVDLQKQYAAEGLQVVGISVDEDASPDELTKFAKELGVNYPILLAKDNVEESYGGIQFLPVTIFIGRDGKIVDKVFGLKGRAEIEDNIKKALSQGQVAQVQQ
jgi:peroxiredoxin